MQKQDGKARTAARLQALEGQMGGIWQALQQLNAAMQGHGMVLKALGEMLGGEEKVQPVLDRLFAPPKEGGDGQAE